MPFQGFTVDDSIDRVGGGKPYLEEGDYLFSVAGIDPSSQDHDGKADFWRWKFRVERGPSGSGRTFPHTGTWKADGQWGNGTILLLVGPEILPVLRGRTFSDYKTFADFAVAVGKKLAGRQIGALVADGEPRNGRPQSEVMEFYPAADWEQRARITAAPRQPVPTAGPTANGANPDALAKMADDIFANELRDL